MSHRNISNNQQGIALLGAMMMVLIVSLIGATLLNLAGQEAISAEAGSQAAMAQQLADAASEVTIAWFHSPQTTKGELKIAALREKRNRTVEGALSFFDPSGRSQFVGTVDQPDLRLQAGNAIDDQTLNNSETGIFGGLQDLGTIEELKLYAPSNPGLLCTVDATVKTHANTPARQSILMQLGALELPPLRAAVQVGQHLGRTHVGSESPVHVHWGDVKVRGNLILRRAEDVPLKSALAAITGQTYDEVAQREDRWMEVWVGGTVHTTSVSTGSTPSLPHNLHEAQNPVPGVRLDLWNYEQLKRVAKRFGRYFAIDQEGLLYPQGVVEAGHGVSPDEVFRSQAPGDQQGLIFIDTLDQAAPRADNLGVITLHAPYIESTVVMQGHVVLAPGGPGQSIHALSPPQTVGTDQPTRTPLQLNGIHFNGVLYASGNVTVTGDVRFFGALVTEGTIAASSAGSRLEVWYDHDAGQGLYRGLPIVYRAPGTWVVKY